tara:strand:+ start:336 stop:863 length:528 start_codon:yes stop_codon:yes gene_type:complete
MTTYSNAPDAYTNLSGTNFGKGLYIATATSVFYNQSISDVQFYAYRSNSEPSKTLYARLRASDGTLKHTFWSMPYDDLPTSGALTTQTTSAYTSNIAVNDVIVLEVDPAPTTATLYFGYYSSDNFDGTNTTYTGRNSDGTYPSITSYDSAFSITLGGSSGSGGVLLPPPYSEIVM